MRKKVKNLYCNMSDETAKIYVERVLADNCRSLSELQDLASRGNLVAAARLECLREAMKDIDEAEHRLTLARLGRYDLLHQGTEASALNVALLSIATVNLILTVVLLLCFADA